MNYRIFVLGATTKRIKVIEKKMEGKYKERSRY